MAKKNPNMEGEERYDKIEEKSFENLKTSCFICKHLNKDRISCKAFPEVIPEAIMTGQVAHTKPILGQKNKIVFEKE